MVIFNKMQGGGNMEILLFALFVFIVWLRPWNKTNSKIDGLEQGKWYKTDDGFVLGTKLVGVTYEGRQKVISQLKPGDLIEPKFFVWEGQPALNFLYNNRSIGVLPKENAHGLKKVEPYITKVIVKNVFGGGQYNLGVTVYIYLSKDASKII
jgi:hypothetical protein